ncbi:hypothetical protein PEBR_24123 [Penicillium brasilianum]|uniref:Uncharacterized protein n=1 Tax=Penicillium brasilianum TaxID=104259 RepID=A0A1S9RLF3_PENBI|nr:hypothetical protein PEBR_24123 [Penicillium brasilianum]
MCFGSSSSKEKYPPPRRINYGNDYNQYIRDYDNYQRANAQRLKYDKKKASRRAAVVAAAAGASGGGGGGC